MNIVQIGSNDCFTCDDCFKFVEANRNKIDRLICVDPNIDKLSNCFKVYENFDFELQIMARAIITDPNQKTVRLYYSNVEVNGHHTSIYREHLLKIGWEPYNIYHKDHLACTANQLFGMSKLKTIDRLYVDCEGYDVDIISSIDYNKYDVKFIRFENTHSYSNSKAHSYYTKMSELGYKHRHGPESEVWK